MALPLIRFDRPEGFWLAAAAIGVLLAHLVRRRPRRTVVPFLPLWAATLARAGGGFGTRLVRLLELLLFLLACGAIAGAAGEPRRPGRKETLRDLLLLLDGGLELRARGREEAMRAAAEEEILRRAEGTRYVLIAVGDGPERVLSTADRGEALSFVRGHAAGWMRKSRENAMAIARAAAPALRDADRVLVTHRDGGREGFRLRAVGGAAPNAGFLAVDVARDPEGGGRIARLLLRGEGRVSVEGLLDEEIAGERTLDARLPLSGRVEFRIRAERDHFPDDDVVRLFLPERRAPRLLVVAEGESSPFLAAALGALEKTGRIAGPLDRAPPAGAAEAAANYDLLLFFRCAPPEPVSGRPAIFVAPPPGALPFRMGEEADAPAFFSVEEEHPLLRGVDLARIPPRRGRAILDGDALASSGSGPLVACSGNWVALGFDPDRCVLAASPSWPIFLRNAIDLLAPGPARAEPEYRRIGERPQPGAEALTGPPGFREAGDSILAVNLLERDLDLRPPGAPSDPPPPVGEAGTPDLRLEAHFAAAGILLLVLSWLLYWKSEADSRPNSPA